MHVYVYACLDYLSAWSNGKLKEEFSRQKGKAKELRGDVKAGGCWKIKWHRCNVTI